MVKEKTSDRTSDVRRLAKLLRNGGYSGRQETWRTLHSDTSWPFDKPTSGRIAVKVIKHLGNEVMKVFRVN